MLKKHGYACDCAENGFEALQIASTKKYNLILMVIIFTRFCVHALIPISYKFRLLHGIQLNNGIRFQDCNMPLMDGWQVC